MNETQQTSSPTACKQEDGLVTTIVSNPTNKVLSPVIDGETGRTLEPAKPEYNPLADISLPVRSIRWAIKDLRAATVYRGISYLEDKRHEIQDRDERRAYSKAILDLRDFHIAVMEENVL